MAWTQRGSRVDRKFSVRRLDRVIIERTLLAVRGAGEILGKLAVLDSQPRTATVIAAETCQIRIIPAAAFLTFVEEHELLAPLLRHAIARVRESEAVRLELATASVPLRLASALSRLVEAASVSASDLAVRLPQTELSQMIGASRNAVVNALKPWREKDWVRTTSSGGRLVRDISSCPPPYERQAITSGHSLRPARQRASPSTWGGRPARPSGQEIRPRGKEVPRPRKPHPRPSQMLRPPGRRHRQTSWHLHRPRLAHRSRTSGPRLGRGRRRTPPLRRCPVTESRRG
ncbi:Crp/Fnr family transcriptional regulator [Streptomyces sp. NPDC056930]|uniref:Crp/Fnr family transcriptional regulator n=1 Tax=Streptomyces sp. NPDC056930 TaxID=3345967 RepID=UPI00363FF39C